MKMEPIEGTETSAIRTKTPWNYPKREHITLACFVCSPEVFKFISNPIFWLCHLSNYVSFIHRTSHPQSFFIHLPMKMEPIDGSETSDIRTKTPGNYPKRKHITYSTRRKLKTKKKFIRDVYLPCVCNLGTQKSPRVGKFCHRHQSDEWIWTLAQASMKIYSLLPVNIIP